jgi:dihydropyrimidine dehydrogenase (NAD+) subunit PreT
VPGEDLKNVEEAIVYIGQLRQARSLAKLPVGRRVVVIGGGMTAIDVAVQSRLLGAEDVTILYRRGKADMKASGYEQDLAQTRGVRIKHWLQPKAIIGEAGRVVAVDCAYTTDKAGRLVATGETTRIEADSVFKAIGQAFVGDPLGGLVELSGGRIKADPNRRTSHARIWAGGDCVAGGKDLTVAAVEDGKRAAQSIHAHLAGGKE